MNMLTNYENAIKNLPLGRILTKKELLTETFLLERSGQVEIYYAPHNAYQNPSAKIVIVGICPGWTQTEIAFRTARQGLAENWPQEEILKACKKEARFAGTMRTNLIHMLDEIGLQDILALESCAQLFTCVDGLLHTTSLLPYPVFVRGKNYTGYNPSMRQPLLKKYLDAFFTAELNVYREPVLLIPLGKVVEEEAQRIIGELGRTNITCLRGLPHPSGANARRLPQMRENGADLAEQVRHFGQKVCPGQVHA
ncbi:hypothetical protein [Neobittarella massiliensis]|uniref:hypothetical protein n=1 Tax=Neobittarella massiliensis (ex Bilen et al. 2018) TaxID=2041842 RepID=UPI000CF66C19|nr:hypothetical protein [Neobittarella massiliensis]